MRKNMENKSEEMERKQRQQIKRDGKKTQTKIRRDGKKKNMD